ncbi:MAG TPA: autotransporter-associated beta strand repeat-containing protein, partial [Candidatus Acidoferrales bacterium]|nr:autotransporter-associated beta strand repeat-containing protein [Candidatus Acidoferrales bacterium]
VNSGTLALSGSGSISSALTQVQNGTLSISGGSQTESFSTLNFSNGTFNVGAQLASINTTLGLTNATIIVTPNYNNVGGSAVITTPSLVTGGATNIINVSSIANLTLSATLPFDVPLISYSGGSASFNGGFNFGLVPPAGISGYITNNTANSSVDLVVTVAPQSLTWNGGSATDNNWSDAANWSGLPIGALDALTFDGLARTNNINNTTAGTDYAGITFNNTAGTFILNGNPITLSGTMINNSPYTQTVNLGLDVASGVTLDGGTSGGTLAINGGVTNLASAAETVTLQDNGTINDLWATANPSNQLVLSVGSGANDWVILDGTGNGGLVQAGNVQLALNSSGTAEFDFGTSNSAPNVDAGFTNGSQLNIEGTTALFNMNNGTLKIASATVGSSAATFNLNGGTLLLGSGSLSAGGGSGADTFSLVITNGSLYSTNGGNFTIGQRAEGTVTLDGGLLDCGTLLFTTGEGSGGIGTIVLNGGTFICTNMLTGTSAGNGSGILQFNGGTLEPGSGSSSLFKEENSVPITASVLANAAVINTAGFNTAFNASLISDPSLGGAPDGGLVKLGAGMLTMSAANSYLGNTVVSNGTLFVSGSLSNGTVNVVASGTLAGTGSIGGAVTNNGTLAPGGTATVGTLTVSSNVVLNGTTFMKLNNPSSDKLAITGGGTVTYGGTLSLTNISGAALAAGNSFTLFSADGYSGSFSSLSPATPGAGLAWNTSNLRVNGTLSIVAVPVFRITSIAINGPALTLKATGGQDGAQFKLLESTNLVLPINQWTPILTNNLDGSGNLNLTTNIVGAHTVDEFYILLQ